MLGKGRPPPEGAVRAAATPDLPAHGTDRTPVAGATPAGYVERVTGVLDGLAEPAVLVRHSMSGAVVCEAVYVLASRKTYGLGYAGIRARLVPILSLPGFHLSGMRDYNRALDLCAQWSWADFEDALAVALMERKGIEELLSYNRGYDAVELAGRSEP